MRDWQSRPNFNSHRQLILNTVNSLLTDTSLNWRHVELIPAVTRHSDGHHSIISKADNGHFSSNSKCKILIPLQRVMGNCANVFKLDKKANLSGTPRFLDKMKHVEYVVTFWQGMKSTHLNGLGNETQWSWHQDFSNYATVVSCHCSRVPDQLIQYHQRNWHGKLLDGIQFESLTTLAVESFFKGMRADHDIPRVLQYAHRRARCVNDNMLRIYQKIFFYFTGPNSYYPEKIINSEPPNIGARKTKQMATQSKETGSRAEGSRGLERVYKGVLKRTETGKCTIKDERADRNTALCYRPQTGSDSGSQLRQRCRVAECQVQEANSKVRSVSVVRFTWLKGTVSRHGRLGSN